MGIIAVGLFSIPVGIIGDGFADWAQDNVAGGDDEEEEADAPGLFCLYTGSLLPLQ
jgi:hypothetical protein